MTTAPPPAREDAPSKTPNLPRTVLALGWVSLLTDAASDMIYPLVPELLRSIGGGPVWIGWFEGVAEAVATTFKLAAGRLSDEPRRRKPLIALGYTIAALTRPLFAIASAPLHAVLIRAVDRVGKGLRGPPRDAMVAGAVAAEHRGLAFGFHRMMDNFGGVLGPVLAFALLSLAHLPLRTVFALAVVPGLLAVVVVQLFVKDPSLPGEGAGGALAQPNPAKTNQARLPLTSGARRYLIALFVFSLAGSGDLFFLRRMTDLGLDAALVPLVWISLQLGKGLLNVPGGKASDRYGRKRVLAISWLLYGATYVGFGLAGTWTVAWVWLGLYAAHYGLAEGGQRALLAELVPAEIRGRAFGYQLAVEGLGLLLANVIFGIAYEHAGGLAAFAAAGIVALAGALLLTLLVPLPPRRAAA